MFSTTPQSKIEKRTYSSTKTVLVILLSNSTNTVSLVSVIPFSVNLIKGSIFIVHSIYFIYAKSRTENKMQIEYMYSMRKKMERAKLKRREKKGKTRPKTYIEFRINYCLRNSKKSWNKNISRLWNKFYDDSWKQINREQNEKE